MLKILYAFQQMLENLIYVNPHFNALKNLFITQKFMINENQTFLIVGGGLFPKILFALKMLNVPDENITIWDSSLENLKLAKTKMQYSNIKWSNKEFQIDENDDICFDNIILPMSLYSKNKLCFLDNKSYNIITHDWSSTFYNSPLITYYNVYFGIKKLIFIPSNKNYTIRNIEKYTSFIDTFFYIVKLFTITSYSKCFISLYRSFFPDPLTSQTEFKSLNNYFLRDIKLPRIKSNVKIVYPCCGIIQENGKITSNELFVNIKNEDVKLQTSPFSNYLNIFLRPHDYHYVHSPISGKISNIKHYQGTRYPLSNDNKSIKMKSLIENTKISFVIENEKENMLIILIGGFFIGSIDLFVKENSEIKVGEKLGCFNFGSSILLLHNNNCIYKPAKSYIMACEKIL
jgi:phosphatidylserine decarboxylase